MGLQPPRELKVEVTWHCPLGCIHCSGSAGPYRSVQLSGEKFAETVEQAAELGVRELVISGGEPLTWNPLLECVKLSAKLGLIVTIYTSGHSPIGSGALGRLQEAGAHRIVFSLFGSTPQIHERITRRAGSFDVTTAAIGEARKLGLDLSIHFVVMRSNLANLPLTGNLAATLGVRLSVLRLVPQGRARLLRAAMLKPKDYPVLKRHVENLRAKGLVVNTGSPHRFLMLDGSECTSATEQVVISPDLRIHPCDAFKGVNAEDLVGTAEKSSLAGWSLADCWAESPYLARVRSAVSAAPEGWCRGCLEYDGCRSGCIAQRYYKTRLLKPGPDPMCMAKDREVG